MSAAQGVPLPRAHLEAAPAVPREVSAAVKSLATAIMPTLRPSVRGRPHPRRGAVPAHRVRHHAAAWPRAGLPGLPAAPARGAIPQAGGTPRPAPQLHFILSFRSASLRHTTSDPAPSFVFAGTEGLCCPPPQMSSPRSPRSPPALFLLPRPQSHCVARELTAIHRPSAPKC